MKLMRTSHFGCSINRAIVLKGVCEKPNGSMNDNVGNNTCFFAVRSSSMREILSSKVVLMVWNLIFLGRVGSSDAKTDTRWSYLFLSASTKRQQNSVVGLYLWPSAAFRTMTGEPSSPPL